MASEPKGKDIGLCSLLGETLKFSPGAACFLIHMRACTAVSSRPGGTNHIGLNQVSVCQVKGAGAHTPQLPLHTRLLPTDSVPPPPFSSLSFSTYNHFLQRVIIISKYYWFDNFLLPVQFSLPIPTSGSWAEPYLGSGPSLQVSPCMGDLCKWPPSR